MKRFLAIALILCAFCSVSFAVILISIAAPQDDRAARASIANRPELVLPHAEYTNFLQTRIWNLTFSQCESIFGPKLETATNWWEFGTTNKAPDLAHRPDDRVLPLFVSGGFVGLSGLGLEQGHNHTDLYAIGDFGYLELYSQLDGESVQYGLIYLRADSAFIPLKSTSDFPARLAWEKRKFDALKSWFDTHVAVEKTK